MNVAIFGATGRTGQVLAEVALAHGDAVRALVRGAASPSISRARERLTLVRGDPQSESTIAQTIHGADVVCCVFGPRSARDAPFCALLTRRIVEAMGAAEIRRLVCVTGAMVDGMPSNTSVAMRAAKAVFDCAHRALARDLADQETAIGRRDLAEFLHRVAANDRYVRQRVYVRA